MRVLKMSCLIVFLGLAVPLLIYNRAAGAHDRPSRIGERPALEEHLKQANIEFGKIAFDDLLEIGEDIFAARWTLLDGQGRPAAK